MVPTPLPSKNANARGADRISIYLAAGLYFDGSSTPVRIRNISASGALLEGALVPLPGELVQLVRGALIVHGLVAWSDEGRCGLKFSGQVDVQQWRAVPTNTEQQRVDEVVRLVKAGAVPLPVAPLAEPNQANETRDSSAHLTGDLRRISGLLEDLGAVLAGDRDLVARHSPILQNVDIAMQLVAAVESSIASFADLDVDASKLVGLRRSADQALRRAI